MATGLRVVLHQTIIGKTGFAIESLFDTDMVSGIVREGVEHLSQLENEVSRQEINIMKGNRVEVRDLNSSRSMRKRSAPKPSSNKKNESEIESKKNKKSMSVQGELKEKGTSKKKNKENKPKKYIFF